MSEREQRIRAHTDKQAGRYRYSRRGLSNFIQWVLDTMDLPTVDAMQDEVAVQFQSPGEINASNLSERTKALRRTLCWDVGEALDMESAREVLFGFAEALQVDLRAMTEPEQAAP